MLPFRHRPLGITEPQLRLIQLCSEPRDKLITFEVITADFTANFTALSYCWGTAQHELICLKHADDVDYAYFHVRKNLYTFLRQLARERDTRLLWIDAICIDQSNVYERNQQVQQIGKIYSQARHVIVWLGNDPILSHGLAIAAAALQLATSNAERLECLDIGLSKNYPAEISELSSRLFLHPYWSRLWIIQEFILPSDAALQIRCRNVNIPWSSLGEVADLISLAASTAESSDSHSYFLSLRALRSQYAIHGKQDFLKVIPLTLSAQCADIRDRIYGLLSLVENGTAFPADYRIGTSELLLRVHSFFEIPWGHEALGHLLRVFEFPICRLTDLLHWEAAPGIIRRLSPYRPMLSYDALSDPESQWSELLNDSPYLSQYLWRPPVDPTPMAPFWALPAYLGSSMLEEQTQAANHAMIQSSIEEDRQEVVNVYLYIAFVANERYSIFESILVVLDAVAYVTPSEARTTTVCIALHDENHIVAMPRHISFSSASTAGIAGSDSPILIDGTYLLLQMSPHYFLEMLVQLHIISVTETLPNSYGSDDPWLEKCHHFFSAILEPMSYRGLLDLRTSDCFMHLCSAERAPSKLYSILRITDDMVANFDAALGARARLDDMLYKVAYADPPKPNYTDNFDFNSLDKED